MSFGIPVRNGLSISLLSTTALSTGRRLVPALNLDFLTATGALDPRITFSRGSNATLVDATGKLTYAPNNLLTNSESFDNAAWSKTGHTISANTIAAPNGTTTADTLVEDTSAGTHEIRQDVTTVAATYTFSAYIKAANRTFAMLYHGQTNSAYVVNLSTGAASGNAGLNAPLSGSVTDAGNGWYRVSMTVAATAALNNFRIYPLSNSTTYNYTGSGTGAIYIWGAQLSPVTYQTTPGTYNSTTPKNLLGFTQEFDNAAWTKSNAFVQTNLLTYSQDFGNAAWSSNAVTRVDNAIAAPDGTLTAEQFTPTTASATHTFWQIVSSVTSGATYSASYYIKPNGYTKVAIVENNITSAYTSFDLSGAGSVITNSAGSSGSVTAVGGGWYRIVHSSASGGTAFRPQLFILPNSYTSGTPTNSWVGDGTSGIYAWGAQLVQGSTAGDYQRTDAAAAAVQYTAPDGTLSADKLVENTATNQHIVFQAPTFVSGTPYTWSAYVKAAGRTIVQLRNYATSGVYFAEFDLVALTTTNRSGSGTATITSAGNDWYRISATATATASGSGYWQLNLCDAPAGTSYTGDGSSGIYIWGAQLSDSASLDPYVYNPAAAAASAAYYGPRFDYDPVTLAAKGLLIEEQRTNLFTYSEQFDNAAWAKGVGYNSAITANSTIAPDGTVSADTLVADNSGGTGTVILARSTGVTSGTSYTLTFFAKAATLSWIQLYLLGYTSPANGGAFFNLSGAGSVGTVSSGFTAAITPASNGWYRCSLSFTAGSTVTGEMRVLLANANNDTSVARNGTSSVYVYGAQLEAGSFATSYIPTVASQVTRSADVALMQGANFSSWYNQNEGTFTTQSDQYSITSPNNQWIFAATDGTSNNYIGSLTNPSSYRALVVAGGATQASIINGTVSTNTPFKSALAYKTNDFAATSGGAAVGTDTSGSVPALSALSIGAINSANYLNGHIRSIGYYNTRLPNTALVSLTAPNIIPSLSLDFTTQVFNVG